MTSSIRPFPALPAEAIRGYHVPSRRIVFSDRCHPERISALVHSFGLDSFSGKLPEPLTE
jgi:hypothetical protein